MSWEDLTSEIAEMFGEYAPATCWDDDLPCPTHCVFEGCSEPRTEGTNVLYCDKHSTQMQMVNWRKPRKVCSREGCYAPKGEGRGVRFCAAHREGKRRTIEQRHEEYVRARTKRLKGKRRKRREPEQLWLLKA
jgi:hypothetical protein